MVAAALHRRRQLVRTAERADEQRHEQRNERFRALEQVAALEVRAAGALGGHDLVRLLDERGDEAQRDGHHHRQLMHRHAELLERAEQVLQPVGQADGAGGIGQQEGAHDEQRDAQHHGDGGDHALARDVEDPELRDDGAGGVEEVQHRGEGDDEQHRLEAAEERPRAHLRDAHGDDQRQDQHAVGNGALCQKDGYDIKNGRQQLGARVEPVGERVAWEILAEGDVLQHTAPPFRSASSAAFSSATV